jgi:hypothetical protein
MAEDSQAFDTIYAEGRPEKVDFSQPLSERLDPKSPLHGRLISELQNMVRSSEQHIEQRYDDWERVDEQMRLYLDIDRPARRGDKSEDTSKKNMPYKDSISMPLIYSTVMTRVAVLYSQLTARLPHIHLEGRGSEDMMGARIHEAMAEYDMEQTEIDLQIWQGLMDVERYGMAIWYDTWEEKFGYKPRTGISPLETLLLGGEEPEERQYAKIKEWNNVRCIDPRDFRPDPNVPVSQVQEMNFVGHKDYQNYLWYAERRLEDKSGPFFNLKAARDVQTGARNDRNVDGRWESGEYRDNQLFRYPNLPVVHFQWKLIPKDWGLSPNENPEIWWISVVDQASTSIIIRAHRSVYAHGEFTYGVAQPDLDQHAPFVPGMGQQLIGIQDTANWLVNSHIVQAKKIINDQVIFNDDLIDPVDMASPGPAKHIRLTKRGKRAQEMGQMKIGDMYGQFGMVDVTKQHLETVQFLFPQAQRMAATPDTIQGMPLPTKRTLGEVEQVNQSATLRLGQASSLFDKQLIGPMARRLVANRQQFTSMPVAVRLTGRLIEQMSEYANGATQIEIGPDDLAGNYDYIAHTPTMAPDPSRMTALWGQLLQVLAQAPQLMNPDPETGEAIDPHAVFDEFVRSAGVNYLDQFKKTIQPMPGQAGPGQMPPDQPAVGGQASAQTPEQTLKAAQSGTALPG